LGEISLAHLGVLFLAEAAELRSVNGPNYGRIYDAEVVNTLVEKFGDGVSGQWRVPGEFGSRVTVLRASRPVADDCPIPLRRLSWLAALPKTH
jgi:hypothetical protein